MGKKTKKNVNQKSGNVKKTKKESSKGVGKKPAPQKLNTNTNKKIKGKKKPEAPGKKSTKSTKIRKIFKNLDPVLIILLLIGILALGALALFLISTPKPSSSKKTAAQKNVLAENQTEPPVCTTPECTHVASFILRNMDPDVDPCDDFYSAACGKFAEAHVAVDGYDSYGTVVRQIKLSDQEIINLLNSKTSKSEAEVKAKMIYKKCFNDDGDVKSLYAEIKKIGGFPALDKNWDEDKFDLTDNILAMAKIIPENLGIFKLEAFESSGKIVNGMLYVPATFSFTSDNFEKIVREIATQFGLDDTKIYEDFEKVRAFSKKIKKAIPNDSENTFDKWQPTIHNFEMKKFIENIVPSGVAGENKRRQFDFGAPYSRYFKTDLNKILEETNSRDIQNFLVFRFIEVMNYIIFEKDPAEKQKFCIRKMTELIPGTFGMAHAFRNIKKENIHAAEELVRELKLTYKKEFEKSEWMDAESKKNALKKLADMDYLVGYPKHFADPRNVYLRNLYNKFNILPEDSFFQTAVKIHSSYSTDFFLAPFRNETMGFVTDFLTWNAFYYPFTNTLMVASLPLRAPTFDVALPFYHNLGAVGTVIGHEIGHGFDTFSSEGVWSKKTNKVYESKADCLKNQFEKYKIHGKKVDGAKTLRENVADNFGIRVALNTMKRIAGRKNINEVEKLPGLQHLSLEQSFFYSNANMECAVPVYKDNAEKVLNDTHTPNGLRVIGEMSNTVEFAKAFNCKPNSPMNPVKKCRMF